MRATKTKADLKRKRKKDTYLRLTISLVRLFKWKLIFLRYTTALCTSSEEYSSDWVTKSGLGYLSLYAFSVRRKRPRQKRQRRKREGISDFPFVLTRQFRRNGSFFRLELSLCRLVVQGTRYLCRSRETTAISLQISNSLQFLKFINSLWNIVNSREWNFSIKILLLFYFLL